MPIRKKLYSILVLLQLGTLNLFAMEGTASASGKTIRMARFRLMCGEISTAIDYMQEQPDSSQNIKTVTGILESYLARFAEISRREHACIIPLTEPLQEDLKELFTLLSKQIQTKHLRDDHSVVASPIKIMLENLRQTIESILNSKEECGLGKEQRENRRFHSMQEPLSPRRGNSA